MYEFVYINGVVSTNRSFVVQTSGCYEIIERFQVSFQSNDVELSEKEYTIEELI